LNVLDPRFCSLTKGQSHFLKIIIMNFSNCSFLIAVKTKVFYGLFIGILTLPFSASGQYTLPILYPDDAFIGNSNSNNRNVNHQDGTKYQDVKRATGIMVASNTKADGFCSCTIMNSTKQDGKILLLTAAHCLLGLTSGVEVGLTLSFNYEHPDALARGDLIDDVAITKVFIVGGTLRLIDRESDIALIEVRKEGSDEWYNNVYASGWNASLGYDPVANISHPKRDHKKIFLNPEETSLKYRKFLGSNNVIRRGSFYETVGTWNERNIYPQKGASGSGLFDIKNNLLGVL
jgi:hypothetical protein